MRTIWIAIGRALFWLLTPVVAYSLARSHRTRVVVVCDDQVLVMKNWLGDGRWALPGGGLHAHEQPMAGAIRELEEETGLKLTKDQLTFDSSQVYSSGHRHFPYALFITHVDAQLPIHKSLLEATDLRWLRIDALHAQNSGNDVLTGLQQLAAQR